MEIKIWSVFPNRDPEGGKKFSVLVYFQWPLAPLLPAPCTDLKLVSLFLFCFHFFSESQEDSYNEWLLLCHISIAFDCFRMEWKPFLPYEAAKTNKTVFPNPQRVLHSNWQELQFYTQSRFGVGHFQPQTLKPKKIQGRGERLYLSSAGETQIRSGLIKCFLEYFQFVGFTEKKTRLRRCFFPKMQYERHSLMGDKAEQRIKSLKF